MKYILTSFLLFTIHCTKAQELVINEPCSSIIDEDPSLSHISSFYDSINNKLCLIYMDMNTLYINTYIDMKKVDEFKCYRPDGLRRLAIPMLIDKDHFCMLYYNEIKEAFFVLSIDLLNKTIKNDRTAYKYNNFDEIHLSSFYTNGKFYIVSIIPDSFKSTLYEYDPIAEKFSSRYIPLKEIAERTSCTFLPNWKLDLLYIGDNTFIHENNNINPLLTNHKKRLITVQRLKFFTYNNHLIITLDIGNDSTRLLNIDLDNFISSYEGISYPGKKHYVRSNFNDSFVNWKGNSYFIEGKLFQVMVSNREILYSVVDIDTKKKLAQFSSISKDTSIGLPRTPLNYFLRPLKLYNDSTKIKEYKMKKYRYREFKLNDPFIYVNRNYNNKLDVVIGIDYNYVTFFAHGQPSHNSDNMAFLRSTFNDKTYKSENVKIDDVYFNKVIEKQNMNVFQSYSKIVFTFNGNYYLAYFEKSYDGNKQQKEAVFKVLKYGRN